MTDTFFEDEDDCECAEDDSMATKINVNDDGLGQFQTDTLNFRNNLSVTESAGVGIVDWTGMTVQDDDASPSYISIKTLQFDQDVGFAVTNPAPGVVKISGGAAGALAVQDEGVAVGSFTTVNFVGGAVGAVDGGGGVVNVTVSGGGGATGATGGTGPTGPPGPGGDVTPPTVPTALVLASEVESAELYTLSSFKASWGASTDNSGLLFYEVEYWTDVLEKAVVTTAETSYTVTGVLAGATYNVRVRAVDYSGNKSAFTATSQIVIAGDTIAPGNVTAATATGGLDKVVVRWTNPTALDFLQTQVYRGTSAGFTANAGSMVTEFRGTVYIDNSVTNGTAYYYKFTTKDVTGNQSAVSSAIGPATPFKIDSVNVGSYFETAAIKNAYIESLDATKITTGFLDANRIQAASIVASKLSVSQLSAISADMGSITAGTITGALIRTAASGARVELNTANGVRTYNASAVVTANLMPNGSGFLGASPGIIQWDTAGAIVVAGSITMTGSGLLRTSASGQRVEMGAFDETRFYDDAGTLAVTIGIAASGGDFTYLKSGLQSGPTPGRIGVNGLSGTYTGVYGQSVSGIGVHGSSTSTEGVRGTSATGYGGYFSGTALVTGGAVVIAADGGGSVQAALTHVAYQGTMRTRNLSGGDNNVEIFMQVENDGLGFGDVWSVVDFS